MNQINEGELEQVESVTQEEPDQEAAFKTFTVWLSSQSDPIGIPFPVEIDLCPEEIELLRGNEIR